jgi:hypothetical protein
VCPAATDSWVVFSALMDTWASSIGQNSSLA